MLEALRASSCSFSGLGVGVGNSPHTHDTPLSLTPGESSARRSTSYSVSLLITGVEGRDEQGLGERMGIRK